ncbi:MAG: InlB B-repeat-containing protein, partial [Thermomicrobiales bacterium]
TVTKADQTINFGTLAGHTAGDAPFTVSASASSGLTVTFTASGVCTISGTTVTLTGAVGSCTITAHQAGDSNYNAAPDVPQTFAVTAGVPATITVTAGSGQSATVNTAFATALQATVLDDHGNPVNGTNVTFTAPASGASGTFQGGGTTATVTTDSNGVATAPTFTANGTPGTYSVTAAASAATPASFSLTNTAAAKADQTITFGALPNRVTTDPPFTVSATASSGLAVTFTASGVCTVSGSTVTLTGAVGPCAITAQQAGDTTYNAAPDVTQSFSVQAPIPMVTLTVQTAGTGSGTVNPGVGPHQYPNTATASLTATANSGSTFTGWTVDGTFVGFGVPLDLPMTLSHTVVATFNTTPVFSDVTGSTPFAAAISQLAARDILRGYLPSTCQAAHLTTPCAGPGDFLGRAQAAALTARPFGWQTQHAANPFPDRCSATNPNDCIDDELWNDIGVLNSKNIARGYPDPLACAPYGTTAPCYLPRTDVLHIQVVSLITRAMEAAGYWQAVTVDNPALFANVPMSTNERLDLLTYLHYVQPYTNANSLPLLPTLSGTATFPGYADPASRGYAAQVIWQAYASYWSTNHLP